MARRTWQWLVHAIIACDGCAALLCAVLVVIDVQDGQWAHAVFLASIGVLTAGLAADALADLHWHEHGCERCGAVWSCRARDCAAVTCVPMCPDCSSQASFEEIVRAVPPSVWA